MWQNTQEARAEQAAAERKAASLMVEVEDLRSHLEAADKEFKTIQGELQEAIERVAEASNANASLAAAKRKADAEVQALSVSLQI